MNAVNLHIPAPLRSPEEIQEIRFNKIKEIAIGTFLELGVSLALAAGCCAFVATPLAIGSLATGVLIQTIISLAVRLYVGYHEYKQSLDPEHLVPTFAKWLGAYSFASGSALNAQTVVHEAGHAITVNALLTNAAPKITLFPYEGGVTRYGVKGVTELGKKIGVTNIQPIVAAAGPCLTLALSTLLLGTGLATQEAAPEISRMLIVSAVIDFISHILYALSALSANLADFSHDFVALWQLGGVHPLAAAVTIAAIPVLLLAGYFALKQCD